MSTRIDHDPRNAATDAVMTDCSIESVTTALGTVDDPEYPGVSIVELGLVERVEVADCTATIELVPTFSGCPALAMIADDVRTAVQGVDGIDQVDVVWLTAVAWTTGRMSPLAEARLAQEFTVVLRRKNGTLRCPVCGSDTVADQSMAGPTRCRSVAWCPDCRNPVEVFRT